MAHIHLLYLLSGILFIYGLKLLSSPKTARKGNGIAVLGMTLAMGITLFEKQIIDYTWILAGIVVGSAIGAIAAKKVRMTQMPQMVALFNGFGGGASTLVAYAEYQHQLLTGWTPEWNVMITIVLCVLVGTVTFFGSLIAFAKLQGILRGAPIAYKGRQFLNALLLIAVVVAAVFLCLDPALSNLLIVILGLAWILGITSVIPVGGADMPVVISLLNSCSGVAAAMTGFVLNNNMLIIAGALVGASGLILTKIMCTAMNRSLANVLFAAFGSDGAIIGQGVEKKAVTAYTAVDAAIILNNAQSVVIVPGYGLAVAQAQHVVQEAAQILMGRGVLALRMPFKINVDKMSQLV